MEPWTSCRWTRPGGCTPRPAARRSWSCSKAATTSATTCPTATGRWWGLVSQAARRGMTSADPRVGSAIEHWAPRFIANGIDYNDFQTTLARIERWERWCAEWSRTAARHKQLAREAEGRDSPPSAGEAYARAALCYHFGKFLFFQDMDQLRAATAATARNYQRAAPLLDPPAERVSIPYAGTSLPGYLRVPRQAERPPVVLLLAGLDSVKEEFGTFEPLFLRRGVATLAFDGPGRVRVRSADRARL